MRSPFWRSWERPARTDSWSADAAELRIKETDRIATVIENLRRMGIHSEEMPDGFHVPG